MTVGKELKNKIEESVQGMAGDSVEFELDEMSFLIVRNGTEEFLKAKNSGKITLITPQTVNGVQYAIFSP